MWSRVVEVMLGCWLLISPFLFRHAPDEPLLWINDLSCGTAVILFGLLSYWRPTQHAHLLTLAVGVWLLVFAYLKGFGDAPPASQNHLILGMLLLMFAVIPNHADRPAPSWEEDLARPN
jgi:hypothetical protein